MRIKLSISDREFVENFLFNNITTEIAEDIMVNILTGQANYSEANLAAHVNNARLNPQFKGNFFATIVDFFRWGGAPKQRLWGQIYNRNCGQEEIHPHYRKPPSLQTRTLTL